MKRYPFGRAATPRSPSADGQRQIFVLGAYPSALHVQWTPPLGRGKLVKALAVDDEPEPFWTGKDEAARISAWMVDVSFDTERWGQIGTCKQMNGPTGKKLDRWLDPLVTSREDCWITDCLDVYRLSKNQAKRIKDTYRDFAAAEGLTDASIDSHPEEDEIVSDAVSDHLDRLRRELLTCAPRCVITLGNAAQRTLRKVVQPTEANDPGPSVGKDDAYGVPVALHLEGVAAVWYPVAHPAAPPLYQTWHARWRELVTTAAYNLEGGAR